MTNDLRYTMIAAVDQQGAIGSQGTLPWRCPADMRHFQSLTMGKIVVMGRKTADSLPKALRGRVNVVLTRSGRYDRPGFIAIKSTRSIPRIAREHGTNEVWIIGGGELYRRYMGVAQVVHLTVLQCTVDAPDTWFPMGGLSGYQGVVAQSSPDPNVVFWTYTLQPQSRRRAQNALLRQMDLDQHTGYVVAG